MDQQEPHFLEIGQGENGIGQGPRPIAYRFDAGASKTAPAVVWLSGFLSDMASTKVLYLSDWAAHQGYAMLRFDYSGHGLSGGDIEKASVGDWLEEARTMLELVGERPVVLVGSSLGGWISLLLARALAESGDSRLQGLVLIAPAWDMTEKLMWEKMGERSRNAAPHRGRVLRPVQLRRSLSDHQDLIEEGRNHLLASGGIAVNAPVRILQGMRDEDVPWEHARALVDLATDDVELTLVKTGDHRSKPEDLNACRERSKC